MTFLRHEQIDRLFEAALPLPPEERARMFDEACAGDPGLRAEVESLLRAYVRALPFFEALAVNLSQALAHLPDQPPLTDETEQA